jgi:CHAD domain-containing protein
MLAAEKGVRKGNDVEKIHEMRVAVRRMRTALRVFRGFLDREKFRPFARELKTLGRILGPVRDLDVWISNAAGFRETLGTRARFDLDLVLREWRETRGKLHARVTEHLESPRYCRFKREFPDFLRAPSGQPVAGESEDDTVRPLVTAHLGPLVLYERLAAVRAYEGRLERRDTPLRRYHRFRIEIKRLRYALEFLTDITGPEANPLIDSLKNLQDHLGELREAWMTANTLRRMLKSDRDDEEDVVRHPGIAAYLASREHLRSQLLESFPSVWAEIRNPEFHRRFAALTAAF